MEMRIGGEFISAQLDVCITSIITSTEVKGRRWVMTVGMSAT